MARARLMPLPKPQERGRGYALDWATTVAAEDKALQAASSAVQAREGGDPLLTATLSSQAELSRVEELDSLESLLQNYPI